MDSLSRARGNRLLDGLGGLELCVEHAKPFTAERGDSAKIAVGISVHTLLDVRQKAL